MYFEMIESSKTWTCPKDGTYLITCVAGGGYNGGATSFGGLVSVSGQRGAAITGSGSGLAVTFTLIQRMSLDLGGYNPITGEYGGYTKNVVVGASNEENSQIPDRNGALFKYSPSTDTIQNLAIKKPQGYGAGGAGGAGSAYQYTYIGSGGKIIAKTVELTEGEQVACTVGTAPAYKNPSLPPTNGVIVIKGV